MERRKFRFYPTDRQERQLAREFGCVRHAFNFVLKIRTDSVKSGKSMNYAASSREWTKHRNDPAFKWLLTCSSVPQQRAVRNLQFAYSSFFANYTAYPKFKKKRGSQTAEYSIAGFKWDAVNRNLTISKVGRLRVKWSREFTSKPSTVTIIKDCAGRYFVSLCLDEPAKAHLPKTGKQVGIDLGISRLATLSNGERIANPKHSARQAERLARMQRVLCRRQKGSARWEKQRSKIARLKTRIVDSRKDFLDKLTTDLIRRFDVLAIEHLAVKDMIRNGHVSDGVKCAAFGEFRNMLEYKSLWYGKEIRYVDRFFPSSKRCFLCGHIHEKLDGGTREFDCENCGEHLDRDENASKNILKFAGGRPVKVRGGGVSPFRALARKGNPRRSANQPALKDV